MRLGVITDIHLHPTPDPNRRYAWHNPYPMHKAWSMYEAALTRLQSEGVEAIAILGDVTHVGDRPTQERVVERAAKTGLPVWLVAGNHDATERARTLSDAVAAQGGAVVTMPSGAGAPNSAGLRLAGVTIGSVNRGDSAFALEALPVTNWGDGPVLLLSHCALVDVRERFASNGLKHSANLDNHDEVVAGLRQRGAPTLILSGHLHVRDEVAQGNALQLLFAALIEAPHEAAILEIEASPDNITVSRRNIGIEPYEVERAPILSADATRWTWRENAWRQD